MPNIDEILGKLGQCQYLTTIYLAKGFHQIEMDQDSIQKTAFSTKSGHYEYVRMPFGLRNAPATFQRCMNNILRPLLYKHCLVYLDDIIVFSSSLDEHLNSLQLVFNKLSEAKIKLQLNKCKYPLGRFLSNALEVILLGMRKNRRTHLLNICKYDSHRTILLLRKKPVK